MKKNEEYIHNQTFVGQLLAERKEYLRKLKDETEKRLNDSLPGSLRISSSYGRTQYYYREKPSDRTGKYLPDSKIKVARALAQKGYEKEVRDSAIQEIKAIKAYETLVPDIEPEEVYEHLSANRRSLVKPIIETDEQFIKRWKSVSYKGKSFLAETPEIYTGQGERVRSKSEVIIADLLYREGIPYRYEYPLKLKTIGYVHPDFTVLNIRNRKELYWEHFGMMDDSEYAERAVRKISEYIKNGIFPGKELIISTETRSFPLNTKEILAMIEHYIK